MLTPCHGCGALFPAHDGPMHRYLGASAACWALFNTAVAFGEPAGADLVAQSRIPEPAVALPANTDPGHEVVFGDAYAVQHHGESSPQAIQSVAVHLLDLHGILSGRTTQPLWAVRRALRVKGVFHKLTQPPLGSALTIRHLFAGGGVSTPATRAQYVVSVYEAWMSLHRATVEQWYERYVAPD